MLEEKFTGSTMTEAHRKADDWLVKHPNVRYITRKELLVGFGGPPPVDVTEYSVTLYYETDGRNERQVD